MQLYKMFLSNTERSQLSSSHSFTSRRVWRPSRGGGARCSAPPLVARALPPQKLKEEKHKKKKKPCQSRNGEPSLQTEKEGRAEVPITMRSSAGRHLCLLLLFFPLSWAEDTKKDVRKSENVTVWGQAKTRRLFARHKISPAEHARIIVSFCLSIFFGHIYCQLHVTPLCPVSLQLLGDPTQKPCHFVLQCPLLDNQEYQLKIFIFTW
uniref:Agouti-signaling protein-like n=1 Tax=Fundulus heteroclitus TaxID=8078 RepID=A0A3Q2UK05_FUNHE